MAYINGHELLFGVLTLPVGGSAVGEAEAASTAKSLTITEIEISGGDRVLDLIAALTDLWDWDSTSANDLIWGNFKLQRSGSSLYFYNNYTSTSYDSSAITNGTVKVIKSSKSMMIIAPISGESSAYPYAVYTFGYMVGADGTKYKSAMMQESRSSDVYLYGGFDDGTQLVTWSTGNRNKYLTTTGTDILVPLVIDDASGYAAAEDVFLTVACSDIRKTGLYTVGEKDYYYGLRLAIKDGG